MYLLRQGGASFSVATASRPPCCSAFARRRSTMSLGLPMRRANCGMLCGVDKRRVVGRVWGAVLGCGGAALPRRGRKTCQEALWSPRRDHLSARAMVCGIGGRARGARHGAVCYLRCQKSWFFSERSLGGGKTLVLGSLGGGRGEHGPGPGGQGVGTFLWVLFALFRSGGGSA